MSELETLNRIQELDTRLFELGEAEKNHPLRGELAELAERVEALRRELDETVSRMEGLKAAQKRMEDEDQRIEEKLRREEDKLMGGRVTSPKELRGLEAEVRSLKRQRDSLETELLEEMERLDDLKARESERREALEVMEKEIASKAEIMEEELSGMRAEIDGLEQEKARLRGEVDGELLELYDRLLESKHHLAVVKVTEGVCQGCRVELPGKEYDRFLKTEDVFRCPNCRRILVKGGE